MSTATFIDDNLRLNYDGRRQLVLAGEHRLTAMKKTSCGQWTCLMSHILFSHYSAKRRRNSPRITQFIPWCLNIDDINIIC